MHHAKRSYVRVTVGTAEQNQRCVEAMRLVLVAGRFARVPQVPANRLSQPYRARIGGAIRLIAGGECPVTSLAARASLGACCGDSRCWLVSGVLAFVGRRGAFVWPSAPAKIARALESGDVAERRQAAALLGEMPEPAAAPLLVKALGDQDYRRAAARGQVGRSTAEHRPRSTACIPWLSDSDVRVRLAACELIRYVPTSQSGARPGAGAGRSRRLRCGLPRPRRWGRAARTEAVGPLLGHLDDPAPNVRAEVAQALARIGDPSAAVPLIGKVGDSAPEVRRAVARCAGRAR